MRRLSTEIIDGEAVFSDKTLKHIKVLRFNLNEKFELLTNKGVYESEVISLFPFRVKIGEKLSEDLSRELPSDIVLFLPLLKNGNFELCLQKAVELGVKRIVPITTTRTIVKISEEDFEKKSLRYRKIIEEAAEQSNRDIIPQFDHLISVDKINSDQLDFKFVPYEGESLRSKPISRSVFFPQGSKIGVIIGPEGGFEIAEISSLQSQGFTPISLGRRILRAETAVINFISVLAYLLEDE